MEKIFSIKSVEELDNIVDLLLSLNLKKPVVLLYGEIGAGKTEFVRRFCLKQGFKNVSSPTFNIHHLYQIKNMIVNHIDFYRIKKIEHIKELDLDDIFEKGDITFIEWPELLEKDFLNGYDIIKINISIENDIRKVKVEW